MAGYFNDHGGTVVETDLEEFLDWAIDGRAVEDLDNTVEIGGTEIPVRPKEPTDEDEMGEEDMYGDGEHEQDGTHNNEEETEMSETESKTDDGQDEQDEQDNPTIKDVMEAVEETTETVKETQDTIKSLDNRVEDLEAEVFGKDGEEKPPDEASGVDADTIQEEAEKALAKSLGLDDRDLEEADDRSEVIRKNLHEVNDNSKGSAVDEWDPEEIEAGFGGAN
jgi:uncharacterized coiled-coil protein SlyX